jgi:hypothetical protein
MHLFLACSKNRSHLQTNVSAIADALLQYFIDAGGKPGTLHCDFDKRFLAGKARRFIKASGVRDNLRMASLSVLGVLW